MAIWMGQNIKMVYPGLSPLEIADVAQFLTLNFPQMTVGSQITRFSN